MNRTLRYARTLNVPLSDNMHHSFAAGQALAIYGNNAVYSFIPKNACSTLRYSIAIHNGYLKSGDDPHWIDNNNATLVADRRMLIECNYNFVVLRCPYRRLASAYLDKIVKGDPYTRVLLAKSPSANDISVVTRQHIMSLSFFDFARLCLAPRSGVIDFHWLPQIRFLVYEEYDDWFSLEDFAAAADTLGARGLAIHDTRTLISHSTHHDSKVSGNFARVPASDIALLRKDRKVPDYRSMYDDDIKAIVKSSYAADIQLYSEKIGAEHLLFS
jgi:hypothetical protein